MYLQFDINGADTRVRTGTNKNLSLEPNGTGIVEIESDLDMQSNNIFDANSISSSSISGGTIRGTWDGDALPSAPGVV